MSDPGLEAAAGQRLSQIEEVILAKVQQRTPQRMNEDTFIVKTFRYHDLSGSGFCEFDIFRRALGPFSSGIADSDLHAMFVRYSPRGPLNYKTFAAEFVDGVRRQPNLEHDGLDAYEAPQETLLRVKDFLLDQGPRGIVGLATAFRDADPENFRSLPYSDFHAVMSNYFAETRCQVRDEQLDQVFELFRQSSAPDRLSYDELFGALQDEPGPERRGAIRAAFRRLDTGSEGLVDAAHVLRSFNANRHPQVSDGSRQPEEVLEEFSETLADCIAFRRGQRSCPNSLVAWEEFEDYYKFTNGCYPDDDAFCTTLQRVWDLDKTPDMAIEARASLARPAAGIPARSRAGLHHWQANTLPTSVTHHAGAQVNIAEVLLRIRVQIARRGVRAAVEVVRNFYNADDDMDDLLDVYEFRRACKQSGFGFRDPEEAAVFEACGVGPPGSAHAGGRIQVPQFLRLLQGSISDGRLATVERAFRAIGGEPTNEEQVVSPAALKEFFNAEAHPLAQRGELEPAAVLSEFLDSFSLLAHVRGGCQNGMVAFSDFLAYYEVVSSIIDNDTYFDLLVNRTWSVPDGDEPGSPPASPRGPARPQRSPSPMKERGPPLHDGPSAYARTTPGLDASQELAPGRLDTHRRFARTDGGQAQLAPVPAYSPITKSSIVFDEKDSGELGAVLGRLRESLAKRGVRAWRSLAQRFQQHDNRKNGAVMRMDFERLHRTLGLGLSPEEREILFKGFSRNRKDGAMDYRECLRRLCGSMPERRQALAERLFDALSEGGPGVSAEALKARFDARASPSCLLGRQDAQQAAQDFCEAVDFFGGGQGFDEDRFMELFLIFSALHEEEDEFRLMTTAAFGLSPGVGQGGA